MKSVALKDYSNSMDILNQYPLKFLENNSVIKLSEEKDLLSLGVTSKTNSKVLDTLKEYHKGKKIDLLEISSSELSSYISKKSSQRNLIEPKCNSLSDLTTMANNAPIINLVNSIIIDGVSMGASDIHIEAYRNSVLLRYRVDGVLIESDRIEKQLFPPISSRIKIMSNLNIMEKREPQDGRTSVKIDDKSIDLRVSIMPLSNGESIVLRVFVKKENRVSLEELGYKNINLKLLRKAITMPHGLILITGPTGSGKTTTLNALLSEINNRDKKIITIEDPVEYAVNGVNQIQVNNEIDLGFSAILRRVLRQDPDVILIGEIRDRETAELVIRAALTGHLVLSTLHTNDSASAISRLKDLGVADYLITSVLKLSIAQRLVRTMCIECHGQGCRVCQERGFKGRVAISEGFLMDDQLESIILDGAKPTQIKSYLSNKGMEPLYSAGMNLVSSNVTTIEEIKRVLID